MAALVHATRAESSFPVTVVSRPALRLLVRCRQLRVHSAFSAAVNLRAGDRLITCTGGGERAPHGLALTPEGFAGLRQLARNDDDPVLRWSPRESRNASLDSDRLVYDPSVPSVSRHAARAAARELLCGLEQSGESTGFGSAWAELVAEPGMVAAADALRRGRVDGAVIALLGRGPGLTPSGDDVLVGVLAAQRSTAAVDADGAAQLARVLDVQARRRTTDISVEYLHYAARGMATGAVCALLLALGAGDGEAAALAVSRLRGYGHTSGMDTLLGVMLALTGGAF